MVRISLVRAAHRVTRYHGRRTRTMHCLPLVVVVVVIVHGGQYTGRAAAVAFGRQTVGNVMLMVVSAAERCALTVCSRNAVSGGNSGTAATPSGLGLRNGPYVIIIVYLKLLLLLSQFNITFHNNDDVICELL